MQHGGNVCAVAAALTVSAGVIVACEMERTPFYLPYSTSQVYTSMRRLIFHLVFVGADCSLTCLRCQGWVRLQSGRLKFLIRTFIPLQEHKLFNLNLITTYAIGYFLNDMATGGSGWVVVFCWEGKKYFFLSCHIYYSLKPLSALSTNNH
jgi:hypothetical protein